MSLSPSAPYQCILLKLSGEALGECLAGHSEDHFVNRSTHAINYDLLTALARNIKVILQQQVQVGIVMGGGNWFRGKDGTASGLERVVADQIGMLATVMNAMIIRDVFIKVGLEVCIMSAIPMDHFVESFELTRARKYLRKGKVVLFAGGTGHPFVSTDAAASLRALEIQADILLKATSVDGIYSKDPKEHPDAIKYTHLTYQTVLNAELAVMDLAAFIQCRDYQLPIRVFDINRPNALIDIVHRKSIGTLVSNELQASL